MSTESQHKALVFIREFVSSNGFSPTLAEIAKGLGIKSRGVIHRYVQALASDGYIDLTPGRQRNIKLIDDNDGGGIPLLGQIAAGLPIEAIEDVQSINPTEELKGEERYALRVKGNSMVDAGILDGDIVVIKHQQTARNGDIVVALIESNEATLKRFRKINNDRVELIPENSSMETMVYHKAQVAIQGVLVGQFRTYS